MKQWIKPTIRRLPTRGLIPLWSDRKHPMLLLKSLIIDIDVTVINNPSEPVVEPCSHETPCGRPDGGMKG